MSAPFQAFEFVASGKRYLYVPPEAPNEYAGHLLIACTCGCEGYSSARRLSPEELAVFEQRRRREAAYANN